MEEITHKTVDVNGIKMHFAEKGEGPVILFLHGFPELWYSWRHQITSLAARGFRAVAPDMPGYGDTDAPVSSSSYTYLHIVGDIVGLIDAIAPEEKVFVVGHDWGAIIAWYLCLFRPERVKALVNLSVQFMPRDPKNKPLQIFEKAFGDDFYICRFQEPGEMEAEFAELGTKRVIEGFLTIGPDPLLLPKGKFFREPVCLPSWISEEDVNYYAGKFEKTGFTGGLNYYRAMDLSWELTAAWTGAQVKVPVKFIIGDLDLTYNFLGFEEYLNSGGFKRDVPTLEEVVVMEGVGHFINQERAEEINNHIYDYFKKF